MGADRKYLDPGELIYNLIKCVAHAGPPQLAPGGGESDKSEL